MSTSPVETGIADKSKQKPKPTNYKYQNKSISLEKSTLVGEHYWPKIHKVKATSSKAIYTHELGNKTSKDL